MNQELQTQQPDEDIIESLQADVQSPADAEVLKQWDREEALRSIGHTSMPELVQLSDGTVATKETVDRERAEGQAGQDRYDK